MKNLKINDLQISFSNMFFLKFKNQHLPLTQLLQKLLLITIHGINSDLEAKLPKIFKNGSVSQSQWLGTYKGKKFTQNFFFLS